jgi:hypothetical protein
MLATSVLLYESECWPHLCFYVDPNVGHICASVWIRMFAIPVLLCGSECWPRLCFCVDPNVCHTCDSMWIRMFAATVLISVGCRRKKKLVERSRGNASLRATVRYRVTGRKRNEDIREGE